MAASGQRDRLVTIQALTESTGASRYPVESWADLVTVWAHKEDIGARERFIAEQHSAPYDTRWSLPWDARMDPDTVDVRKTRRLIVGSRVHDIVAAKELGRRQGIAVETLAGGLVS